MKILFLEDDPNDLELVQRSLNKAGVQYSQLSVFEKEAYIDALKVFRPDVILSEHSLPGFNSTEAFDILKQSDHTAVFILVTGTVSEEFAENSIKKGVDDFILKSNLARLPLAIERALSDKQRQREKEMADQQLAEKNMFLSMMVDSLPVIYFLLEYGTHKLLQLNGNFRAITGYDQSLFLDRNFWVESIHPDDIKVIEQGWSSLESSGRAQLEYRIRNADQSYRWVQEALKVIVLNEKRYVTGMIMDVTGMKQAHDELRRNKQRWKSMIENSSDIITLLDKDGTILYESPSVQKVLGYTPEELTGKNVFEFLHPDDMPRVLKLFHEQALMTEVQFTELQFLHKEGYWITLEVTGNNLLNQEVTQAIVINARDITERKRAERALEREQKFLKAVLDNINVGVIACDKDGEFVLLNKKAHMLGKFGGGRATSSNWQNFFEIYDGSGKNRIELEKMPLYRALRGEQVFNEEYVAKPVDLDIRISLLVNGQPLKNKKGESMGAVIALHDISYLKQTEARLRSKIKDLDTYIYRTSHDLKGPLSSVQGLVNLAQEQVKDDLSLQILGMIGQSNARLEAILRNLTEVTHVLNAPLVPVIVNIHEMVNDITSNIEMPRMKCAVDIDIHSELCIDRTLLHAILKQLISNSVKYRKPGYVGCFVNISVTEKQDNIYIRVQDNGRGIPESLHEKVFEMFFRGTDDEPGTGLGLYLARSAAEKLGGYISLTSIEGEGTAITVTLPRTVESRSE